MILIDLIRGNKTKITSPLATAILAIPAIPAKVAKITSPLATAILAIPAILNPNQAKNSRIAEIAIAEPETTKTIPTHCKAIKVGGRICGAPLKTGLNGWMSCSDMACQVPVSNQSRNNQTSEVNHGL